MLASKASSQASAQCKAELKAEALKGTSPYVYHCDNFNNYRCERRVFSPNVATLSHSLKECLPGGDNCVDVEVNQFSTASALAAQEDAALFAAGGSYNREEVRCHHRYFYQGVAVFEGEGDSLEAALAGAMKACERAGEEL